MTASTNLRIGLSTLSDYLHYRHGSLPFTRTLPPRTRVVRDTLMARRPYPIRLADRQGFFLCWYRPLENPGLPAETVNAILKNKGEHQWITLTPTELEVGVCLFHEYPKEVIISGMKYSACVGDGLDGGERYRLLRGMWRDLLQLFPDKTVVCPSGALLDNLSLALNGTHIQREPYHRLLLKKVGFRRHGSVWYREAHHAHTQSRSGSTDPG